MFFWGGGGVVCFTFAWGFWTQPEPLSSVQCRAASSNLCLGVLESISRDFAFQTLNLKYKKKKKKKETSSGALTQLSNASSQTHVKFPSPPAATLSSSHNRKSPRTENGFLPPLLLMEWHRVEIKGFGLYLLQWESFPPTGKRTDMRVREGGCYGTTCCRCPTVLTAQIRERGKYLLENHRALDIF